MSPVHLDQSPKPTRPCSNRMAASNRQNAQKSTGPRTEAGKKIAALNALEHGLTPSNIHLTASQEARMPARLQMVADHAQPRTTFETYLVEKIALASLKLDDTQSAQALLIDAATHAAGTQVPLEPSPQKQQSDILLACLVDLTSSGKLLLRYETAASSAMFRSLGELRQKLREPDPDHSAADPAPTPTPAHHLKSAPTLDNSPTTHPQTTVEASDLPRIPSPAPQPKPAPARRPRQSPSPRTKPKSSNSSNQQAPFCPESIEEINRRAERFRTWIPILQKTRIYPTLPTASELPPQQTPPHFLSPPSTNLLSSPQAHNEAVSQVSSTSAHHRPRPAPAPPASSPVSAPPSQVDQPSFVDSATASLPEITNPPAQMTPELEEIPSKSSSRSAAR